MKTFQPYQTSRATKVLVGVYAALLVATFATFATFAHVGPAPTGGGHIPTESFTLTPEAPPTTTTTTTVLQPAPNTVQVAVPPLDPCPGQPTVSAQAPACVQAPAPNTGVPDGGYENSSPVPAPATGYPAGTNQWDAPTP